MYDLLSNLETFQLYTFKQSTFVLMTHIMEENDSINPERSERVNKSCATFVLLHMGHIHMNACILLLSKPVQTVAETARLASAF